MSKSQNVPPPSRNLASPHPIAMPEPEPEPEPDDDEDDDQDGADEDELVVVTEQDREAFAAMMAEREAKLKAQLDRVARVDDSKMQPHDGPWSTEEVLRATKYPLLEAALKLRCEDVTTLEAPGPGNRRRQARAAPRGSTIALLRFFDESRRFSHRF